MIDIHCHILPEIDDGPKTMRDSVAMAEFAVITGTSQVFATPHITVPDKMDQANQIAERVGKFQSELDLRSISLEIVPGAEVYPSISVVKALESGAPITLGPSGKYILLDTPSMGLPLGFEQMIFDIQMLGITPIMAHPERCRPIQENPQIIEALVQRGMLIQSNAGSVIGTHGCLAQITLQILIRLKWVHFIASDAHSTGHRSTKLKEAREELIEAIGESATNQLLFENGRKVCNGQAVPTDPADYSVPRRRTWFGQLFKKDRCCAYNGR